MVRGQHVGDEGVEGVQPQGGPLVAAAVEDPAAHRGDRQPLAGRDLAVVEPGDALQQGALAHPGLPAHPDVDRGPGEPGLQHAQQPHRVGHALRGPPRPGTRRARRAARPACAGGRPARGPRRPARPAGRPPAATTRSPHAPAGTLRRRSPGRSGCGPRRRRRQDVAGRQRTVRSRTLRPPWVDTGGPGARPGLPAAIVAVIRTRRNGQAPDDRAVGEPTLQYGRVRPRGVVAPRPARQPGGSPPAAEVQSGTGFARPEPNRCGRRRGLWVESIHSGGKNSGIPSGAMRTVHPEV